jgi:hypothetical protein
VQAVEAVGNVFFCHVDIAVLRVGVYDLAKDAVKAAAKLHGLGGGQANGLAVDVGVGVVHDRAGTSGVLGNNANRGDA